jgi:hypothetical protein
VRADDQDQRHADAEELRRLGFLTLLVGGVVSLIQPAAVELGGAAAGAWYPTGPVVSAALVCGFAAWMFVRARRLDR